MDPSFGARLRAQRERQQVALSAISKDTKIKLSMLEGLERDDVSQWPEGIYRRAYVRAYARAIGLDPETLVREFLEVHPDPIVIPIHTETELENPQWPTGFRRLVTSAMAAVPSRRADLKPELSAVVDDDPPVDESAGAEAGGSTGSHNPHDDGERRPELSLQAAAELCTRLGRVVHTREVAPILTDAAIALDAVGLILWRWDSRAAALRPWLAHGYTDAVLARMSGVHADADNAIAAAFQSARPCVINSGDGLTGAVVVPLMSHSGCVGVLAIELHHGDEQRESVRAFATILAAQFVTLVGSVPLAEAVNV
jgi:transcriptional regulator with XRE-family HTH domain